MPEKDTYDSIVIGSGPNGLAAAVTLARSGKSVVVFDAKDRAGGGVRSQELTLPGFVHDVGSAIFPMAASSPFFSSLPLLDYGLEWIYPPASVAHPFDDGTAAVLYRSLDKTLENLGADARAYERLVSPFVASWNDLAEGILQGPAFSRFTLNLVHFGLLALWPVSLLARCCFRTEKARSLFAGLAAHSILPLSHPFTSAFALVMAMTAHNPGWPIPKGGSQNLALALENCLESMGGEMVTAFPVKSMDDLPQCSEAFFDLTPRQILTLAGRRLPETYCRRLARYRYGPGAFKIDWALDGPIPWKARECAQAGTVHLGGTFEEIALSERQAWRGIPPERPFVLCAQQSLFDHTRAPENRHTAWAYCHVPNGSRFDMIERIEGQIERFAPGFRDRILSCHVMNPHDLETFDANFVGGDIAGGAQDWRQLFTRPIVSLNPYAMPVEGWYICSSSTPPGAGVHGMCGYNAAMHALRKG
ncbi:MAG TPA: NAD(P)/FAD-dependent oxidoreductase, partial [Deltaproteobacteria bacterium]|nr:NAD(P)/FAD-dependent oxidoreductase [Deltaproteobacteria bacterium]HPJ92628.1 NAD(P)/FAD-dependent oxidoreductase [Deltaproteobacteria bacterium]